MACARVEALRSHGYAKEAIRLARAVATTIRENSIGNFKLYQETQSQQGLLNIAAMSKKQSYQNAFFVLDTAPVKRNSGYGLVGDSLNPIHILFDALTSPDAVAYSASEKREGT